MGTGWRQFKALMRKNSINHTRKAKCSIFELLCPIIAMGFMVYLRKQVHASEGGQGLLIKEKTPTFSGLGYRNGNWNLLTSLASTNKDMTNFFKYANYPYPQMYDDDSSYSMNEDIRGPLYFIPSDCLEVRSFALPKVEMPIIAVVGEWNQATKMMQSYLEELISIQQTEPWKKVLEEKMRAFGKDAVYPQFKFMNFTDSQALFDYTSADDYVAPGGKEGICYGFEMRSVFSEEEKRYELELYFNDQQNMGGPNSIGIPNTQKPAYNPLATKASTDGFLDYLERGYSVLHNLAANVILKIETDTDSAKISMLSVPVTASTGNSDTFLDFYKILTPFLYLLIFIPPVYNNVSLIVREKESRIKETMRMMGMRDWVYWLSWYVHYTWISTLIALIAWGMFTINCINYSSSGLILLLFFLYAQAVFGQIVFLAAIFDNSKFSGLFGSLLYFGFLLVGLPVQLAYSSASAKNWLSIFPQVALQQSFSVWGTFEGQLVGLTKDNMSMQINNYSFSRGLYMLAISFIVFTALGLYLDKVLPKKYGERRSPIFCLSKKFCCSRCSRATRVANFDEAALDDGEDGDMDDNDFEGRLLADKANYEPVSPDISRLEAQKKCLKITNLGKEYDDGQKAVDGINLKMYSGQIFALLGRNGAGKSTTISMLTGLLTRTKGRAEVFRKDLFDEMDDVRTIMGVCPQHDVLFDLLTPEEHLSIFYDFKGGDPESKQLKLRNLVADVGIQTDLKKEAKSLSGGTKRKLSVAIALCGDSKIVMLDEPTAGMDLNARRALWDMLKNYKHERIVVLTTHYMDEADVLGDRIAIMSNGKVVCLGSASFLKSLYGSGYKVKFVKQSPKASQKIESFIIDHIGGGQKLSDSKSEVIYQINQSSLDQNPKFFESIDQQLDGLGLKGYSVSMTSLEEVFLKANGIVEQPKALGQRRTSSINDDMDPMFGEKDEEDSDKFGYNSKIEAQKKDSNADHLVGNGNSFCSSLGALLAKRFYLYKRDKCGLICEILVPVLLVILGLSLLKVGWLDDSPSFKLGTDAYPGPQRLVFNTDVVETTNQFYTPEQLAQQLPDYDTYFQVKYEDSSALTYQEFYQIVCDQQNDEPTEPYRFGSYQIYKADAKKYDFQINLFVNATSEQSVPYFSQYIYESILKNVDETISFSTTTSPFPVFYVNKSRVASGQSLNFAMIMSVALALIPCVIIAIIIKERESKLKHLQVVSGVSLAAYWTSNLISDILQAYVPILIIIALNAAFNLQYEGVWQLLILYPVAIVPWTYVTSFFFTRDYVAQIVTVAIHFFVGGIVPPVIFIVDNVPWTANLGDSMRWWFTFVPSFCVCEGIVWSATYQTLNIARNGLIAAGFDVQPINIHLYAMTNLGGNYTIMLCTGVIGVALLVIIEADLFKKCAEISFCKKIQPREGIMFDSDVREEHERVQRQMMSQDTKPSESLLSDEQETENDKVQVLNLRKCYTKLVQKPVLAVEQVSFGVTGGECFALLGVNGAGKSTTFKSLTRDIVPTRGQVKIQGHSVLDEFESARQYIGYCPQQDAIFPLMTVKEHLWFYAKIKGIAKDKRSDVIDDLIKQLEMQDILEKPAGTLSGGNQRKLSFSIAILGNPPVVLLDEPSSGMDPDARRQIWSVIDQMSQGGGKSAVVLTTHSMEEAEALSTKIGIMVRGGFLRCFGTPYELQQKFGQGIELEFKVRKPTEQQLQQLQEDFRILSQMSRVNLKRIKNELERSSLERLIIDQICKGGFGSHLFAEAEANQEFEVRVHALMSYLFTMKHGVSVLSNLCQNCHSVTFVEQYGDFFKFCIPQGTEMAQIGSLFSKLHQLKEQCQIQEFSMTPTKLEQIFQGVANINSSQSTLSFRLNNAGKLQKISKDDLETSQALTQSSIRYSTSSPRLSSSSPRLSSSSPKLPPKQSKLLD